MKTRRTIAIVVCAAMTAACGPGSEGGDTGVAPMDAGTNDVHATDTSATESGGDVVDANTTSDSNATDATSTPDVTDIVDSATPDASDASATDAASGCDLPSVPPMLDGPNACTTLDFGQPAVAIRTVTDPIVFTGGTIPPGIYDAVEYSRTTGSLDTTYRATLVVSSDGRFTEVRVLSTGSGTPPTTRKSGMWHTEGNAFVRDVSCGGADAGVETNRLTYRVDCATDGVTLSMGLTNLWFTYRRR